ncbi:MAG: SpoIIE family protein phosphatase [Pseudodesulfovibrio sp.]
MMVLLPVWELGVIILGPLAVAFAVRGKVEAHFVNNTTPLKQSLMQFRVELGLFFGAAMIMALILQIIYHFPLFESGMKLVLGIFTVGLFAALDLALARERLIIQSALSGTTSFETPRELSPMTRKFSFIATLILLLITAIIMLVLIRDIAWLAEQDLDIASIDILGRSVLLEIIFVMGFLLFMVINLVFSYARNLRILFNNETVVLESVSRGDLSQQVPVATNDEMGIIAGHTNTMISSLREGVRMREGLRIAKEIQQNFLPDEPPIIPGLELAGTANFSDETGGDFYDFIDCDQPNCELTGVVVGDVSGHGIGAALLMAAGRALIRQSVSSSGAPSQNLGAANKHLSRDINETGRFITLFYMLLDPVSNTAIWINAGHQPPVIFNKTTDSFHELKGEDIPLGVEETWQFHEHFMDLPTPDQILLIGTDGVWEAHNPTGEMYGSARLQAVIRDNADKSAEEILEAVVESVNVFSDTAVQEDDVTLVVIKGVEK